MKHDKTAGPRDTFGDRPLITGDETHTGDDDLREAGWTLIDDADAWEQAKREHAAEQVDASDETRLAAGWVQQVAKMDGDGAPMYASDAFDWAPAPGVAGLWRLHASGVWVRWVLA